VQSLADGASRHRNRILDSDLTPRHRASMACDHQRNVVADELIPATRVFVFGWVSVAEDCGIKHVDAGLGVWALLLFRVRIVRSR
jgi:hypothetical protein